MFKDKEEKQWKFTYMIVEIDSPSKAQLMLESYIPGAAAWNLLKKKINLVHAMASLVDNSMFSYLQKS